MSRLMKCVVLYGEIDTSPDSWKSWVNYVTNRLVEYSVNPVYVAIQGSKVQKYNTKMELSLNSALENGKEINSIEYYSLPSGYEQAAFDYDIYISRIKRKRASFVQLTILNELFLEYKLTFNEIKESLEDFIDLESLLIFEMEAREFPPKYIMSKGRGGNYESLKLIEFS